MELSQEATQQLQWKAQKHKYLYISGNKSHKLAASLPLVNVKWK